MATHPTSAPHQSGADENLFLAARTVPDAPQTEESITVGRFPFILGRHPECDFALFSRLVSRHHCRFFARNGTIWVEDLNSHNGTYLNDREVREPEPLFEGDRLMVYPYQFLCQVNTSLKGDMALKLIRIQAPDEQPQPGPDQN